MHDRTIRLLAATLALLMVVMLASAPPTPTAAQAQQPAPPRPTDQVARTRPNHAASAVLRSAAAPAATPHVTEAVEQLAALMQGSFSSREQAQIDPEYFDIRLHMLPIWPDRDDGRWLYVEQAVAVAQAEPYRQRVYRVSAREDGTLESAVYELPDPLRFALAWKDASKLEALRHEELVRKDGCEVLLRQAEPGRFVGATGEKTCASELRGASWATSEVEITKDGVRSWDRGFDQAGVQVWGATKGGYSFRHDDPEALPVQPTVIPGGNEKK